MKGPLFGPAGRAVSFKELGYKDTVQMPEYLRRFGLTAFEYQAGHGVRLNAATGEALRLAGLALDIAFSIHAPYYISMGSADPAKRQNSLQYLLQSAKAVQALGGNRVVFHCGGAAGRPREEAMAMVRQSLADARALLDDEGLKEIHLCPETMGKTAQLGSLEEVLALCVEDVRHIPCLDFGHLNAVQQGALRTEADFADVLDKVEDALADDRAKCFHVHFSKIEFGAGGERRHLTFADSRYGPPYQPFLELCAKRGLAPVIICESSGTQTEDAVTMMEYYKKAKRK